MIKLFICLFRGETKDVFPHEDAVYGLSADPCNPSVFASACDDGRLLIFDIRDSTAGKFRRRGHNIWQHRACATLLSC